MKVSGRPKLSDVAKAANVSVSLVSRILSKNMGNTSASDEVVKRVRAAAKALNYTPDRRASNLRTGKNDLIAVMLPLDANFSKSIYTELLRGLVEGAQGCSYDFVYRYYHGDEDERRALRTVQKMSIDGLVYAPNPYMPMAQEIGEMLGQITARGVKVMFCMERFDVPGTYYADVDDAKGGEMVARYLLKRGKKDILYLHYLMERRRDAFVRAAQSSGARVTVLNCENFSREAGYYAIKEYHARQLPLPDALACACDVMAIGVRDFLRDEGIDYTLFDITGFDYLSFMPLLERPFPSIYQPAYEVGQMAVRNLLRALDGEDISSLSLSPELIEP